MGVEEGHFNPLAEQAFTDSVFYLDTNVLIPPLVFADENALLFHEMSRMAKRLGIQLRVTRATINEARRTAADHIKVIKDIVDKVPEELALRTQNEFIKAYIEAREDKPTLTPEEFLEPFERLTEILKDELEIIVDDRIESDIIKDRDFSYAAELIKGDTSKSRTVLNHDLSHYVLVVDERSNNPKTWFLTRDGSLVAASLKFAGEQPFCFSLIGFLQSVSPYLTASEESSFVDVFSSLVIEQMLPMEPVFDTQDLMVLAEMHEDIQHTPPERVIAAYEYIKRSVLHGNPWTQSDIPKVVLGLRRFFTSSLEEQRRALEIENARLTVEREREREAALAERRMRERAEANATQGQSEIDLLHEQLEELRLADNRKNQLISGLQTKHSVDINELKAQRAREYNQIRRNRALTGITLGLICWLFNDTLIVGLINKWPGLAVLDKPLHVAFGVIGLLLFSIPALNFISNTFWKDEFKFASFAIVLTLAIAFSRLLDDPTGAAWSAYLQIGSGIAMFLIYFISNRKPKE